MDLPVQGFWEEFDDEIFIVGSQRVAVGPRIALRIEVVAVERRA
jgi:hypothetical protein